MGDASTLMTVRSRFRSTSGALPVTVTSFNVLDAFDPFPVSAEEPVFAVSAGCPNSTTGANAPKSKISFTLFMVKPKVQPQSA
jgi:hypothetical protein